MVDPHPVGFRFRPTDEEIFNPYLKSKNMDGNTSHVDEVISTVDIYSFDPLELASQSTSTRKETDNVLYFFCPKDNRYNRGERQSRKTKSGSWKKTGVTTNIMRKRGDCEKIGEKRVFVFQYSKILGGSKPKSDWVMHEYVATFVFPAQTPMVTYALCKVMFKGDASDLPSSSAAAPAGGGGSGGSGGGGCKGGGGSGGGGGGCDGSSGSGGGGCDVRGGDGDGGGDRGGGGCDGGGGSGGGCDGGGDGDGDGGYDGGGGGGDGGCDGGGGSGGGDGGYDGGGGGGDGGCDGGGGSGVGGGEVEHTHSLITPTNNRGGGMSAEAETERSSSELHNLRQFSGFLHLEEETQMEDAIRRAINNLSPHDLNCLLNNDYDDEEQGNTQE
uniref:NAC domain-containing protein n=2 Tax=Brassica TaxID=3705 RepID=M4EWX1_BRACM